MNQLNHYKLILEKFQDAKKLNCELINNIILFTKEFIKQYEIFEESCFLFDLKLPEKIQKNTIFTEINNKYEFFNITPMLNSIFNLISLNLINFKTGINEYFNYLNNLFLKQIKENILLYEENMNISEIFFLNRLKKCENNLQKFENSYKIYYNLCEEILLIENNKQQDLKLIEKNNQNKNKYRNIRKESINNLEEYNLEFYLLFNIFDDFLFNIDKADRVRLESNLILISNYLNELNQFLKIRQEYLEKLQLNIINFDCRKDIDCCFPEINNIESNISNLSPKIELNFDIKNIL